LVYSATEYYLNSVQNSQQKLAVVSQLPTPWLLFISPRCLSCSGLFFILGKAVYLT